MDNLVNDFKDALSANGLSTSYFYQVRLFTEYLKTNGFTYNEVDYRILNKFWIHLSNNVSNETINAYVKALKKFYEFLFAIGVVEEEKLDLIKDQKYLVVKKKQLPYINKTDIIQIIEMAKDFCPWVTAEKLEALVWFMFFTGVRRNELLHIKRQHIDLKNKFVLVTEPKSGGSSKMERIIPFPKSVVKYLTTYFASEKEKSNAFNLSLTQMKHLFKSFKEFCPNKNLKIHSLRHSFARYCNEKGIDIATIQKLMGHKKMETTQIYVDPNIETCINTYHEKIKD